MRVLILGCGKVGLPMAIAMRNSGHEVECWDACEAVNDALFAGHWPENDDEWAEPGCETFAPFTIWDKESDEFDHALIVVQTPSLEDGSFDPSFVIEALELISQGQAKYRTVVSTLSPGTELPEDVSYAPVMIQLGRILAGFSEPVYWLVGGPNRDTVIELLKTMVGDNCLFPSLTREEAILAKLLVNGFLTMKVTFANIVGIHCNDTELNAHHVCAAVGTDPRIGDKFFKPGAPYGGPCFPRDVPALIAALGEWSGLARAVHQANDDITNVILDDVIMRIKGQRILLVPGVGYSDTCQLPICSFGSALREELAEVLEKEVVLNPAEPYDYWIATRPGHFAEGPGYDPFI